MNIFYLDSDVEKCAQYHCDKHVVKMILEYSQLLCSVHWSLGIEAPYKLTHKNHPCSIWARQSLSNYNYLVNLAIELSDEYTFRYNKVHKSRSVIDWCSANAPNLPDVGFTELPKAMPDEYKVTSVVESYRNYYRGDKVDFATWKYREMPEWF